MLMQKLVPLLVLLLPCIPSMAAEPFTTGRYYPLVPAAQATSFFNTRQDTGRLGTDSLSGRPLQQIYYQVPARLTTATTGTVYGPDITRLPVASFMGALAGRVPGLYVSQNSGQP